jgi:hypothetical protein
MKMKMKIEMEMEMSDESHEKGRKMKGAQKPGGVRSRTHGPIISYCTTPPLILASNSH